MAKKRQQLSNSALAALVVAALLVSVAGIFMASKPVWFLPPGQQTGSAGGNVTFVLQQVASLKFAVGVVNFGTGFVNTSGGNQQCKLTSEGVNIGCRNFTTVTQGLVLENDGTINITVTASWNKNETTFIGGDETLNGFSWKVANNETGSCGNFSQAPTTYTAVNLATLTICDVFSGGGGGFNFLDDKDTIRIDVNITIPYDALAGPKNATITATGTAV